MKHIIYSMLLLTSINCKGQKLQYLPLGVVDTGSYFVTTENTGGTFSSQKVSIRALENFIGLSGTDTAAGWDNNIQYKYHGHLAANGHFNYTGAGLYVGMGAYDYFFVDSVGNFTVMNDSDFKVFNNATTMLEANLKTHQYFLGESPTFVNVDAVGHTVDISGTLKVAGPMRVTAGILSTAVLSLGSATVPNPNVTASSNIFIEYATGVPTSYGTISSHFIVSALVPGVSFTISALTTTGVFNNTDNSTVMYWIVN